MSNIRNTDAIIKMAKEKSKKSRKKVEEAISKLMLEDKKINFNTVSKESGVSKSWLYSNADIRARIDDIRSKQELEPKIKKATTKMSVESKDNVVKLLKQRIKDLEAEKKAMAKQIETLYGKLYSQNKE